MPNRTTLLSMGLGLVVASVVVGLIVLKQRGATPSLGGEITSVRTLGMDQSSSVAIVDFRFANTSKHPFIVQSTGMSVVDSKGEAKPGYMVAARDANQLFELFPGLGARGAETLVIKAKIAPEESRMAMLTARFDLAKAELDARQKIILSITDVDGAISELAR